MSTIHRTDPQTTKSVVESFYAGLGAGDDDAVKATLHEDAELHQPPTLPYGRVYRGPDKMVEMFHKIIPLSDPTSFVMEAFAVDGERAIVVAGAKTNGGEPVTACEEYTVRDGRIARIRMFWFDPAPMAAEATAAGLTG